MITIKHALALVSLFFPFVVAFAGWEQVLLNDKSDFDTNCEYRAELSLRPGSTKTRFSSTSNKKVGYISNASGLSVNAGILSDNKAIYRFDMPNGISVSKCTVLKLEKRCLSPATYTQDKQKKDGTIDVLETPNKFKFGKSIPEANYGLGDAAYNE
jgi:hypothetical protein